MIDQSLARIRYRITNKQLRKSHRDKCFQKNMRKRRPIYFGTFDVMMTLIAIKVEAYTICILIALHRRGLEHFLGQWISWGGFPLLPSSMAFLLWHTEESNWQSLCYECECLTTTPQRNICILLTLNVCPESCYNHPERIENSQHWKQTDAASMRPE